MQEHRKRFGDFEVIEFVDDQQIAQLRAKTDVAAPLTLNWTWEYGSEVEELRNLYEKGKVNQWNAELDLDWSAPVSKDEWVMNPEASLMAQLCKLMGKDEATQKAAAFDELTHLLSQLLHGEQAALQICGQLTNACDKMDEKWYAASQVADEARHIEVISKFLARKMGAIYPINPSLKILLDELLAADTARKKTLGMQTLFEGMAVGIFGMLRQETRNAFVAEMIRRVEQDEARHAAFGVLSMRRAVREADASEKAEMEDWAFGILEALNANQQMDMLHLLGPKYGIDAENITKLTLQMPNWAELNSLIYMHTVVPNLRNLGLITDRTRERYRDLGMLYEKPRTITKLSDASLAPA
jgi:hypothetical protein